MANSVYNRKAWEEFAPPEDENDEAILDESIQNATFSQTISGMNIAHPEENTNINLSDMLGSINSSNTEYVQEAESKIAALRAEEIAEAEAAEAAAQAERARRKFYEEQALRDERAFKEAQEAAARAEAERERKEKSIVNKVSSIFTKPKKAKNAEESENSEEVKNVEEAVLVENAEENSVDAEEVKTEETKSLEEESGEISETADKGKKKGLFGKKEPKPKKNVKKDAKESLAIKSADPQPLPSTSMDWEYLATHDEMTGMLNVRAYDVLKNKAPKGMSVVFVDINNLKYVNDNFGHESGNLLIKAVANSLVKNFPGDKYRVGGDEFIVILPTGNEKKTKAALEAAKIAFDKDMEKETKNSDNLVFSASIGYGIGNSKTPLAEVIEIADKAMYEAKDAYKKAHPEFDMRGKKVEDKTPSDTQKSVDVDHDDLLTPEQRKLKESVSQGHEPVSQEDIRRIIADVQRKQDQIVAILIASPTFDNLFVIKQVQTFLTVAIESEEVIDYSYLYILYEGGPQYYGSDEYYSEVTHIFEALGKKIAANQLNDKTLQQVPGINVFRNIYTDLM